MFVLEDPAKHESQRRRNLQQSRVRSHLTTNYHHRRLYQLPRVNHYGGQSFVFALDGTESSHLIGTGRHNKNNSNTRGLSRHRPKPGSFEINDEKRQKHDQEPQWQQCSTSPVGQLVFCGFRGQEGRSFRFFQERTAQEWSGWCDAELWNVLALQASHSHTSLKHAIVSLGAFHESLVVTDGDGRNKTIAFSLEQGSRAVTAMLKEKDMSMGAMLLAYTVLAANSAFLHWSRFWQVSHSQLQLFDDLRARPAQVSPAEWMFILRYLAPIIEQQRSRSGQYLDMLHCLRTTSANHFYVSDKPIVPSEFSSLRHARDVLESLLKWTTYITKELKLPVMIIPQVAEDSFKMWHGRLGQFSAKHPTTQQDQCNTSVLRVAAKIGVMLIRIMQADEKDEMIFDNFTDIYRELVDVFKQTLQYTESTSCANIRFGIESGMLALIGNAANRWTRDPFIRRDIIKLLHLAQRREAIEDGVVWARLIECTMEVEEFGIHPPPQSARDIPAERRIQSLFIAFYHRANMQLAKYHLAPYSDSPSDFKEVLVPHMAGSSQQGIVPETTPIESGEKPDVILGRGYTSWLSSDGREYMSIDHPNFYFPLPKV